METILAKKVFSPGQIFVFVLISILLWISSYLNFQATVFFGVILTSLVFFISVIFKFWVSIRGFFSHRNIVILQKDLDGIDESKLPIYTILLPAYKEKNIIKKLVRSIIALDYPPEKLDVKILLEEDDEDTYIQLKKEILPKYFEVIRVPHSLPKTKPKACNVGLSRAKGKYLVIYDAEDIPDRDQLKKAVVAFTRVENDVVCVQAKLNFYNSRQNLITKLFTLDYSAWFDIYLPGLCAIDSPIPLGGTSNHFRLDKLREVGGWDPYNVTEDCDLGMRIASRKYKIMILDSTTLEEAAPTFPSWFRQRTRWSKGYMQTYLVHIRQPISSIRKFGLLEFIKMNLVIGIQIATSFFAPISFFALISFFYHYNSPETTGELLLLVFTVLMVCFYLFFIFINILAGYIRKNYDLIPYALLMPVYWLVIGFTNWRAFFQLFLDPFFWEKTPHGLQDKKTRLNARFKENIMFTGIKHRLTAIIFSRVIASYFFVSILIILISPLLYIRFFYYIEDNLVARTEIPIERSFLGYETLSLSTKLNLKEESINNEDLFYFKVFMKTLDGQWYDYKVGKPFHLSELVKLEIPLDSGWLGRGTDFDYGPWMLRRVRSLGVEIFGNKKTIEDVSLTDIKLNNKQDTNELSFKKFNIPDRINLHSLFEGHFRLSLEYDNPFDPKEVDAMVIIKTPNGETETFPAFYTMDYELENKTCLMLSGLKRQTKPYWSFRYTPRMIGDYTWSLNISDKYGNKLNTPEELFVVNEEKGGQPSIIIKDFPKYFQYDGGDIFFPKVVNIAWPIDDRNKNNWSFKLPDDEDQSKIFQDYFSEMEKYGANLARVWLSPWWGGLEWSKDWPYFQGLGKYNLKNAAEVDCLLADASRKNIYVELTLAAHSEFIAPNLWDSLWLLSPYNLANGGTVSIGSKIFSDESSQEFFRNRLRYTAARFGAYNSVFGWIFMNEANSINGNEKIVANWYQKNADYIRSVDSGHHLISFSMLDSGEFDISKIKGIDYGQTSAYNRGDGLTSIFDLRLDDNKNFMKTGKPFIIGEFAGSVFGAGEELLAKEFHDGIWYALSKPLSAVPSPWWWGFVFNDKLLRWSLIFDNFQDLSDLKNGDFTYFNKSVYHVDFSKFTFSLNIAGRKTKTSAQFWVYSPEKTNFLGTREFGWEALPNLTSRDYLEKVPENFNIISNNDPGLLFADSFLGCFSSGRCLRDDWFIWNKSNKFEKDQSINMFFDMSSNEVIEVPMGGFSDGDYLVEYWDTWDGRGKFKEMKVRSNGGEIIVPIYRIDRDIAIKLKKVEGTDLFDSLLGEGKLIK